MADAIPPSVANVDLTPKVAPTKSDTDPDAPAAVNTATATAAAMSHLDGGNTSSAGTETSAGAGGATDAAARKSKLDPAALGDAMKKLELQSDGTGPKAERKRTAVQIRAAEERERRMEEEKRIKAVRVDPAHVALLVDQLDVSKTRATELLKLHGSDPVRAMTAWVSAAV